MRNDAVKTLSSVIRANTEKRSLKELAAAGKSSFRVISGSRVMELIHAIVDDTIQREATEMVQADRDRIVSETRQQFDRVLAIQAKQEAALQREKTRADQAESEVGAARERIDELTARLDRERDAQGAREAKILAESQERIAGLVEEKLEAEGRIRAAADAVHLLERMVKEEKNRLAQREQQAAEAHRASLDEARTEYEERERRLVADHERVVGEYRSEIERLRLLVSRLKKERDDLVARFEGERGVLAASQETALAEAESRLERAEAERLNRRDQIAALRAASQENQERLVAEHRRQLDELRAEHHAATTGLEAERAELAGRQGEELAAARGRIAELEAERERLLQSLREAGERKDRAERALARLHARLAAAGTRIEGQKQEVDRLRAELEERDRRQESTREGATARSVASLRDEIAALNRMVRGFENRPAGIDDRALDRLSRELGSQRSDMEERFDSQMEKTLQEVTRVLRVATARPVDDVVEATDALVDRIFDDEDQMKTNFPVLEVEERTSKSGIADHLNRLREARGAFSVQGSERE